MPITDFVIVRDSDTEEMPATSENPIGKYILRVMEEEGYRAVDVLENAKRLKIKLKQPTLQNIYSGDTKNPGINTLIDISKALGRPFEEMVAAIQGTTMNNAAFKQSKCAMLWTVYEQLNSKERKVADRFLEMVEREMTELLKQQGETNLLQLRK